MCDDGGWRGHLPYVIIRGGEGHQPPRSVIITQGKQSPEGAAGGRNLCGALGKTIGAALGGGWIHGIKVRLRFSGRLSGGSTVAWGGGRGQGCGEGRQRGSEGRRPEGGR